MFDQLNRFVELSTILIGRNYDSTQNTTQSIMSKNKEIEQNFQKMQNIIPQF